jgi:hypothetical protein
MQIMDVKGGATGTEVAVLSMVSSVADTQLSLRFLLQHLINEFLVRIWDSIFYSQYTHGMLTEYKNDFMRQEPLNWILL